MLNRQGQKRICFFCGLLILLMGGGREIHGQIQIWADLVLHNGRVLTLDSENTEAFTIAEAVAVYDGKIVAVGTDESILKSAGPSTQKIDLKGKTLIPGLIDTHSHPQQYAISQFAPHLARPRISMATKAEAQLDLKRAVSAKKPGEWIPATYSVPGGGLGVAVIAYSGELTRADLDAVAPDNPVLINLSIDDNHALINSKALELLRAHHPLPFPEGSIRQGPDGSPDGFIKGNPAFIIHYELLPRYSPEVLAPPFKKQLDEWAAEGVTTLSTRLHGDPISAYALLDRTGQMPVRIGYSHEIAQGLANPDDIFRRLGNIQGHGTDMLWMIGISTLNIDGTGSLGWACYHEPYPDHPDFPYWKFKAWGPNGECNLTDPAFSNREIILAANRFGFRISGLHTAGDRAVDTLLDLLEEANKERPIAGRRFAADHVRFLSREQAERAQKLGLTMFSISPKNIDREMPVVTALYDSEVAGDVVMPARRIIDMGMRPVIEIDTSGRYSMLDIETLVTRKDKNGRVWGPQQRITRNESLYSFTRWAAEYVLREDSLGSIEKGKWADLVVLDGDFLSVPEDQISDLKVLITIVGGKIVFTEPAFARAEGLPQVGFRGPSRVLGRTIE